MTVRSRTLRFLGALALGAVVMGGGPAEATASPASPSGAAAPAQVTVVHGVRGLVADVRVDGKLILSGFAPERVTDPLALPAGDHRVQIWRAGAAATSKPILDRVIPVPAGIRATLGVGLDAAGNPQITAFNDDIAEARGGETVIAVRHLAATPSVRVTLDSGMLADGIKAPEERATKVAPGSHSVSVLATGGTSPLVPSQNIPTVAGRVTVVYLIGSQQANSLGLITHSLQPAGTAPSSVDTGVGAPPGHGADMRLLALGGLAIVALMLCAARIRRLRPASETSG